MPGNSHNIRNAPKERRRAPGAQLALRSNRFQIGKSPETMPSRHQSRTAGATLPSPTPIQTITLERLLIRSDVRRRLDPRSIRSLADRIQSIARLRSLVVVPSEDAQYYVVAGERRFAALQMLLKQGRIPRSFLVPCRVIATSPVVDLVAVGPGVEADDRRRRFLDLRDRCPGLVTGTELAARRSLSSRHTGHSRKFAAAEP